MRTCTIAAVAAVALLVAACGDDPEPPRDEPDVRLTLTGPADAAVTRSDTVEIAGNVKPAGAAVQVRGEDVAVDGGEFRTEVELEPGANLIDVAASANGRRPDFAALRVVFEQRVALPDVVGRDADTAQEELEGLGLEVRAEDAGGFLDAILPGDPKVCEMDPEAGTQVLPGTEVTVQVARDC
jgi:PASTA domain-containing protein/glucodextranase-like protein